MLRLVFTEIVRGEMVFYFKKTGESVLNGLRHGAGAAALFLASVRSTSSLVKKTIRQILLRQLYFTGIGPIFRILLIGVLVGAVIITQVTQFAGSQSPIIGEVLAWVVIREFGPIFCVLIIVARSCTAIATELGAMRVNRELESLQVMGIDPIAYLVMPRIIAVTLSVVIVTFYFQLASIVGGLFFTSLFTNIIFSQHMSEIFSSLALQEITVSLFKSLVFGLIASTFSCYHGLRVRASITEIPQMTSIAVTQSLFTIVLVDGGISLFFFYA